MEGTRMMLDEITKSAATFSIDPDEARLLAAACRVASDYALDGSKPTVNPFEALAGSFETPAGRQAEYLIGAVLEAYATMFESAGMAAFLEENIVRKPEDRGKYALSAIRKDGTGYRFPFREEREAVDVA